MGVSSSVIFIYLVFRVFGKLLGKRIKSLSAGRLLVVFLIFSFTIFLVFIEVEVIYELLIRQYPASFSLIYVIFNFILGFEISWKLYDYFTKRRESQKIEVSTFLHFFYFAVFSLVYLIFSTFLVMFVI